VLLNLVILAEEALAYGGRIVVAPDSDGHPAVTALGRNAGLKPETIEALSGDLATESLTPRTVHAYVTGRFAQHLNLTVKTVRGGPESFAFGLRN
jgi:histidine phosphotransferase ChpT